MAFVILWVFSRRSCLGDSMPLKTAECTASWMVGYIILAASVTILVGSHTGSPLENESSNITGRAVALT